MSDSVSAAYRRQPTRLPVPGILQARTLEWVAISFSKTISRAEQKRKYNTSKFVGAVKALLREIFIAFKVYIRKEKYI